MTFTSLHALEGLSKNNWYTNLQKESPIRPARHFCSELSWATRFISQSYQTAGRLQSILCHLKTKNSEVKRTLSWGWHLNLTHICVWDWHYQEIMILHSLIFICPRTLHLLSATVFIGHFSIIKWPAFIKILHSFWMYDGYKSILWVKNCTWTPLQHEGGQNLVVSARICTTWLVFLSFHLLLIYSM